MSACLGNASEREKAPAGRGQPNSAQVIEDLETSGQEIDVLVNNAGFSFYAHKTFAEDKIRA
jgi:short-subunit dehydrogenase